MVDQKSIDLEHKTDGPQDPSRRKLLKGLGAGAGLALIGGGFWLGRSSTEPGSTTELTLPPETSGSSSPAAPTTLAPTTSETIGNTEVLSVPLESLPTSIDNPEQWVEQIYSFFDKVYNQNQYDLLDYVFYDGLAGNNGENRRYDAEIARIQKNDDSTDDAVHITGELVSERTGARDGFMVVSVEENLQFKQQNIRRILDYKILPRTIYIDRGSGSEEVTLYLINATEIYCTFEDGVCR